MLRDTSPSPVVSPSSRRWLWLAAVLLLTSALLAACGVTPARQGTVLFGPAATLAPTTTPTTTVPTDTMQSTVAVIPPSSLPTLTSAAGWHTVLTLSDMTGVHGADIAQASFSASKPYVILYSCKGSGALKVLYPETILGVDCKGTPKIHRTGTLKPAQPGASAFVTASPNGSIIWELLVSMQD